MKKLNLMASLLIMITALPALAATNDAPTTTTGQALFFWSFAALVLGGAVFVITRKNLISAVMGMVGTFLCIAVVYVMLFASFLAAIQVLVYAGAIMVLFVFVIMILNKPVDESLEPNSKFGIAIVGVSLAFIVYRLSTVLWAVNDIGQLAARKPAPGFGTTKEIGTVLFRDYLFPFEAVSLVLLTAVVGALAVARPGAKRVYKKEEVKQ